MIWLFVVPTMFVLACVVYRVNSALEHLAVKIMVLEDRASKQDALLLRITLDAYDADVRNNE